MKNIKKLIPDSNKKGLSIILILLIISSILTGTVIVGETLIRHTQIVKGAEVSEKAFFAAETAVEKAIYQVLKNYVNISTYSIIDGELSNGAQYNIALSGVAADTADPTGGLPIICADTDCDGEGENPWSFDLDIGESFQLNLDLNGADYPDTLRIERTGDGSSGDLIVYQCIAPAAGTGICTSTSQLFNPNFTAQNIDVSTVPTDFYRIRINNFGAVGTYTLKPISTALPIGVSITAKGSYQGYERQINDNYPKWQKFGI
ncbi:MAG: hypothetical protein WC697_00170 [Patescibacteria group bacterium]|jgi:hypothetical protein